MVAVAMPSADIEIFIKIVKNKYNKDRYIERSVNDKKNPSFFVAYGDKNSTFFVLSNLDILKPHGIIVRIYPIRKSIINIGAEEEQISFYMSMKHSFNKFIRKNILYRDAFYVRYGLKGVRFVHNRFVNVKNNFARKYPKSLIKERLYDIFGRDSYLTNTILTVYNHIYSAFAVC